MTGRTQINAKLDPVLFHKLADYCKRERVDKSAIVRLSLRAFLDNTGDIAEIKKNVANLSKIVEDNNDQFVRLVETLATLEEQRAKS
jgi:hypothetical protein